MFQANEELRKAKQVLWDVICGLARGDMLRHETAESVLRLSRDGADNGRRYYAVMEQFRRRMERERGSTLISVPLVGYGVATATGQLESALSRVRKAYNQDRRAKAVVEVLPSEECDAREAKAKFGIEEKLAARTRERRQEMRLMAFLLRPREGGVKIDNDDDGMAVAI